MAVAGDRQSMSFTIHNTMAARLASLRKRLPDAISDINRGNARMILEASQPLVPVDTGSLKRSGRVEKGKGTAWELVYGGAPHTNSRTGKIIDYAGYVHYRLDVKHSVGQAQFVGQPLRSERPNLKKASRRAFRKWLKKGM